MESLYLLIPISLIFIAAAVGLFIWAVNSGQYEDIEREGERILFDDEHDHTIPNDENRPDEIQKLENDD